MIVLQRDVIEDDPNELKALGYAYRSLGNRLEAAFEGKAGALFKRHNTLIRIHQLPQELLLHIMELVCGPLDLNNTQFALEYCRQRDNLATVSFSWRNIIKSTPSFWSVCSTQLPESMNSYHISMSAGQPLEIQSVEPDEADTRAFWKLMRSELPRCRRLKAYATDDLIQGLNSGAPLLEELNLVVSESVDKFRPSWRKNPLPHVRRLFLTGFMLEWKQPLFSNLTLLHFEDIMGIEFSILLTILETSPSLSEIMLTRMQILNLSQEHRWGGRKLSLTGLKVMRLSQLDSKHVSALAEVIVPQKLATLEIDSRPGARETLSLYQDPPPFIRDTFVNFITRGLPLHIDASEAFVARSEDEDGHILLLGGPYEAAPKWCGEVLSDIGYPESLRITLGSLNSLHRISRRFGMCSSDIDLDFNTKKVNKKLEAFCTSTGDNDWIMPRVTTIRLHLISSEQALLVARLLCNRYRSSDLKPPERIIYRSEMPLLEFRDTLQESPVLRNCKVYRNPSHSTMGDAEHLDLETPFAESYGLESLEI